MSDDRGNNARRLLEPKTGLIALLLIVATARFATPVISLAVSSPRLPQWDMAKYGVSGLRLSRALQDLDPFAFMQHLNSLDTWPPLFPLLEVPAFFLAGPGVSSARGLVGLLFAAAVVIAFWCGARFDRTWSVTVGAVTAVLVASSPMVQVFATIVMLEIPGVVLLLIAIGSYLRAIDSGRVCDFTLACVAATGLFFCKYNYGLIWIAPMAANELLRISGAAEATPASLLRTTGLALRRPWIAFWAVGMVSAAIIEVAGPWSFSIASRVVSVSSSGPLIYGLYALTLLSWLLRPRRNLTTARRWLARLEPRARSMMLAIALPIGLWMVVPSHAINCVRFIVNRSDGPPILSVESLLFYPRSFVDEFSPAPLVGVAVLLFAASSLRWLRGANHGNRALALALVFSSIVVVIHPYKQPRFFFMAATIVWIAAARQAVGLVALASRRAGAKARRYVGAAVAVGCLMAAASIGVDIDRLQRGHRRHTVHASTLEVVNAIADEAAEVQTSVLLGTWNQLSPWLVEWTCLQRRPTPKAARIPQSPPGRALRGDLLGWLAANPSERVMILSASPASEPRAGFSNETGWLDPVRRQLNHDPRFRRVWQRDFDRARYRLESYEPARTDRQPVPR